MTTELPTAAYESPNEQINEALIRAGANTHAMFKILNIKTNKYFGHGAGRTWKRKGDVTNFLVDASPVFRQDHVLVEMMLTPIQTWSLDPIFEGIAQRKAARQADQLARRQQYQDQKEREEYNRLKRKFG